MPEDGSSATIKLPAAPKLSWRRREAGRSSPSNPSTRSPAATRCCQSVTTCTPWDSPMESVFHTNQKKRLLSVLRVAPLLLLLNAATSAEEKNSQCHNYAGGHVYPGEAFRVPVSDHSLHLSKAKSEFCRHESICGTFKLLVASVDARRCAFVPPQVADSCCSLRQGATEVHDRPNPRLCLHPLAN